MTCLHAIQPPEIMYSQQKLSRTSAARSAVVAAGSALDEVAGYGYTKLLGSEPELARRAASAAVSFAAVMSERQ